MPSSGPLFHDAAQLREALGRARRDVNAALAALAPAAPASTDFRYVDLRDGTARTIPAAQFTRRYALAVHSLQLTIHGYGIRRRTALWGPPEIVFSTRRPARWRRAPPLLALRIVAGAGGSAAAIALAARPGGAPRQHIVVRLDQALQEQVLRAAGVAPRESLAARLLAGLSAGLARLAGRAPR